VRTTTSAAVIVNLDLVLAIDTAVVHVAGALGRPVWAMLSFAPDWRWLLDRDDSPWYPSLRLFRQPIPGDWATVVGNVRRELADLAAQTRPNRQPAARPRPKEEPPAVPALDAQLAYDAAMGHYAAGRIDMTGAAAKEILASHPDHAGAQHLIGLVEINHGRHQDAVDLLRCALVLDPNVGRVHNNLGIALAALGRRDEAIASFRRAVTCDPGLADAHCNLGVLLREANRRDEAAESFRRAIGATPDNAEAHRHLGQTLKRQGQFGAAIESYRRAVTAKPDHADACNELGILLNERGRADEAANSFRRARISRNASMTRSAENC
jgi:Tfp pilus assembly protein PilF